MSSNNINVPIQILLDAIEIPDSAYEKAKTRYKDIGGWLCRPESSCRKYAPAIFAQGSFLLGTVTRPRDASGEYDLDLVVKLRRGVSKSSHTQKELKTLIGVELEAYRNARQIQQPLDEKRRCWRLLYKDEVSFHIDALPCIPEDERQQSRIKRTMILHSANKLLADEVARHAVSITDSEHLDYDKFCFNWSVSNPLGYGHWFANRVRLAERTVRDRTLMQKQVTIEKLPTYKLKAPLQYCTQLLKVHRDVMFKNDPDRQPISVIITTLAARTYQGQEDVAEALLHIVNNMADHVYPGTPQVPNPVNPDEDFSDRWNTPEGLKLDLEGNFFRWLDQAQSDFRRLAEAWDPDYLARHSEALLGLSLNRKHLIERLGVSVAPLSVPPLVIKTQRIKQPPKPWSAR